MYPTSAGFDEAIAASADVITRATILTLDPVTLLLVPLAEDVPVEEDSATVRVDGSTIIRRSGSVVLPNDDGLYTPDPDGLLWWSNPILLEYGVWVDGVIEWIPLVTGWPDEPDHVDQGAGARITVPFRDRLKLLDESWGSEPETYPAATRVAAVVRMECVAGGIPDLDSNFDLDDGGAMLGIDHTYEEGPTRRRLDRLDQLRTDFGLELFASPTGVITLRPVPDPNVAPVVASYQRGADVQLLSIHKRWTPRIKNRVIVEGEDAYGNPFRVEAADTSPDSPYSVQRIGDHPDDPYTSLGITTQQQARDVAVARLPLVALVSESVDLAVPLNPAHEANDIIEAIDSASGTIGRHILDSFVVGTSPSAAGALVTRKVRALA